MMYITGDTHGEFNKLSYKNFTEGKNLTKNDYVIICGDFGYNDARNKVYELLAQLRK